MKIITLDKAYNDFINIIGDYSNWPLRVLTMFGEYGFGQFCDNLKSRGFIIY